MVPNQKEYPEWYKKGRVFRVVRPGVRILVASQDRPECFRSRYRKLDVGEIVVCGGTERTEDGRFAPIWLDAGGVKIFDSSTGFFPCVEDSLIEITPLVNVRFAASKGERP